MSLFCALKEKIDFFAIASKSENEQQYCDSWKIDNFRESNQEEKTKIMQRRLRAITIPGAI